MLTFWCTCTVCCTYLSLLLNCSCVPVWLKKMRHATREWKNDVMISKLTLLIDVSSEWYMKFTVEVFSFREGCIPNLKKFSSAISLKQAKFQIIQLNSKLILYFASFAITNSQMHFPIWLKF